MKLIRRILFVLLFVLKLTEGFSQNAKEDFEKINAAFDVERLSMRISYDLYKNKDTKIVFQKESGELKQSRTFKWMKVGQVETIETDTYSLIIDHKGKAISMLGKRLNQKEDKNKNPFKINLDSILKMCEKVEFKKLNDQQNSYDLVFPLSEYSKIKVVYNSKTFFMEKMILYYNDAQDLEEKKGSPEEAPRLEIVCSDINLDPIFTSNEYTYDTYLEKTADGKWVCKPAYKGYAVSVHLLDE